MPHLLFTVLNITSVCNSILIKYTSNTLNAYLMHEILNLNILIDIISENLSFSFFFILLCFCKLGSLNFLR